MISLSTSEIGIYNHCDTLEANPSLTHCCHLLMVIYHNGSSLQHNPNTPASFPTVWSLFLLWSSLLGSEIANGLISLANSNQLVKDIRNLCSDALWGLFGHYGLRLFRVDGMLGICHPRPDMRFSSPLLLFYNWLAGDYVVLRSSQSPGGNFVWKQDQLRKITQRSQDYFLFTLCSFLWSGTNIYL